MILRILGAVFTLVGCSSMGFSIALNHKREVLYLEQILSAIEYMGCELEYRLTPLPALCKLASASCTGKVREYFISLENAMRNQASPNIATCSKNVLEKSESLPPKTRKALTSLGEALGNFDVTGQLQAFNSLHGQIKVALSEQKRDQNHRLRSYQTLGLCAGASLAILFI